MRNSFFSLPTIIDVVVAVVVNDRYYIPYGFPVSMIETKIAVRLLFVSAVVVVVFRFVAVGEFGWRSRGGEKPEGGEGANRSTRVSARRNPHMVQHINITYVFRLLFVHARTLVFRMAIVDGQIDLVPSTSTLADRLKTFVYSIYGRCHIQPT